MNILWTGMLLLYFLAFIVRSANLSLNSAWEIGAEVRDFHNRDVEFVCWPRKWPFSIWWNVITMDLPNPYDAWSRRLPHQHKRLSPFPTPCVVVHGQLIHVFPTTLAIQLIPIHRCLQENTQPPLCRLLHSPAQQHRCRATSLILGEGSQEIKHL